MLIRRGYKCGRNFDCVVGVDLMQKECELELYGYIRKYKPRVLVMAPQCTGMAGWGRYNALIQSETHMRNAEISQALGTICANCAIMQVLEGRHYFLEQPKGSDLLKLPIFQRLAHLCANWCYMVMCMVGLRSVRDPRKG